MSIFEIVNTLLLKPLELVFEVVYMLAYKVTGNPGLSIIALSLFMNFLVLPLYMRADAIQEEEHAIEKRLQSGMDHIKKTFAGDERMMLLQTYYRQNHYKPMYVLRSAVSLFLQIPFFIAAYRFLSCLQLLYGASFGPIQDLGRQDGMLQFGGLSANILPIIMTVVNLISCVIFTKGGSFKSKMQLYVMALFFLVFLYNSPAGLVFYWTLNNVFSLIKTIFYKLKEPGRILVRLFSIAGILLGIYGFFLYPTSTIKKAVFFAGSAVFLQLPLIYRSWKRRNSGERRRRKKPENRRLFFAGGVFLALLTGALIPSSVIKTSPLEFLDTSGFYHSLWFVASSFCLAFGLFVMWTSVFYFLVKPDTRAYFDRVVWILAGVFTVDYMFFGKDLGQLTRELAFQNELQFTVEGQLKNVLAVIAVVSIFYVIYRFRDKLALEILLAGGMALLCMVAVNIADIHGAVSNLKDRNVEKEEELPRITLSKTGKNVIVLMLDQAIGKYVPYLFAEKPELEEQFAGFTYYANTVSFGAHTNFGTPALFGGYEYTPVEMNRKSGQTLASKHNEALKVMPVLFDQNGYQVTVCDPPFAGYQWIPDLSIYDEYPKIKCYNLSGKYLDESLEKRWIEYDKRNFFCYAVMKTSPLFLQKLLYDEGGYHQSEDAVAAYYQKADSMYTAHGLQAGFMNSYRELAAYPELTDPVEESINTFIMMSNQATHEATMLQEPDYVPMAEVDNTEYESTHQDRYTLNGETLLMTTPVHAVYYQTNMAVLIQLGKWFDYMRENDVYDNTRIILVADHGRSTLRDGDERRLGERDIENFYPLLMVKDFGNTEFTISEEFMTNGDVPTLALAGILNDPINPFTGKMIDSSKKICHDQYIIGSEEADVLINNGNTFLPSKWYSVHDDMRDVSNWKLVSEEETVLPTVEEEKIK
jgi:YidC/Oxa1 family membrane protein insertase